MTLQVYNSLEKYEWLVEKLFIVSVQEAAITKVSSSHTVYRHITTVTTHSYLGIAYM